MLLITWSKISLEKTISPHLAKEFRYMLWISRDQNLVHIMQPQVPILHQINSVLILSLYLFKIHFNSILPATSTSSQRSRSFSFPNKTLYAIISLRMRATFPAHISLLDWSTLNSKDQGVTNYKAIDYAMWRWIPWSKLTDLSRKYAAYILKVKVFSVTSSKPLFFISSLCTFRWWARPYKLLNCWKMNKDFPSYQKPNKSWLERPALQNDISGAWHVQSEEISTL